MLKLGNLWIKLWQLSDLAVWVFTTGISCGILIFLFFCMRKYLEQCLTAERIDKLLKALAMYLTVILPLLSMIALYKGIFGHTSPLKGPDGLASTPIHNWSISYATSYGNHWIFFILLTLWLVGFSIGILRNFRCEKKAFKKLKACSCPCENEEILKMRDRLQKEIGLKKPIAIRMSDRITSPFTAGCFRPEIFFPQIELDENEICLMLCHELIHCKKRDVFCRRMVLWSVSLYWFIPIIKKFAKYYTDMNEMACDDSVLKGRTKQDYYFYAKTLVTASRKEPFLQDAVSLTGQTETQLERRLKNMLEKKSVVSKAVIAIVVIFAAACPLTTLAASAGMCELQDAVVNNFIIEEHEEIMATGNTLVEVTENAAAFKLTPAKIQVQPRGSSIIDQDISGAISRGDVTVTANGTIKFFLEAESGSDSFNAGYKDSSGKKTYVSSKNGELTHTFTIPKAGTYTLFAEAVRPKTIHIIGHVTVK